MNLNSPYLTYVVTAYGIVIVFLWVNWLKPWRVSRRNKRRE